jgi:hypothetical protein
MEGVMENGLEIGLDFDGVVSDCSELKSRVAKIMYGKLIPPAKFKKEILVSEGILTAQEYRELQKRIYSTREFGLLMKSVGDVCYYVYRMRSDHHKVRVITSRTGDELAIAEEWSAQQGLQLRFTGVGYENTKAEAAEGLDVYVDDDLDKLAPLVGIVQHRFLFSWGYNLHVNEELIARRVISWGDFYHAVRKIQNPATCVTIL